MRRQVILLEDLIEVFKGEGSGQGEAACAFLPDQHALSYASSTPPPSPPRLCCSSPKAGLLCSAGDYKIYGPPSYFQHLLGEPVKRGGPDGV
jgi:hypothetical protein